MTLMPYKFYLIFMVSARQTDVEQCKVYQVSIYGKALYDRAYKTAKVGGMFICYVRCERDPVCNGLNFKNTKDICEMNILTTGIKPTTLSAE